MSYTVVITDAAATDLAEAFRSPSIMFVTQLAGRSVRRATESSMQTAVPWKLEAISRFDGSPQMVSLVLSKGRPTHGRQLIEGALVIHLDSDENPVLADVLAPVSLDRLAELVPGPQRRAFRKFLKATMPAEFVASVTEP